MLQLSITILISLLLLPQLHAGRDNNFSITQKYAPNAAGYFQTPHQIKARAYWENYKIIDDNIASTQTVASQVEFAAGTQTADVFIPNNYTPDKPVGIYIHISAGNGASLPSNFDTKLQDHYLIGASPDNTGNNQHDPWRIARTLDLVTTLKAQYNIDNDRVYVGGMSGGALISILCGMLYPDQFTGIIPTEHGMSSSYWQKVFTQQEMEEMAANGQRWAHILGNESYAFSTLVSFAAAWEFKSYDYDSSISKFRTPRFFNSYYHIVDGMTHTNAPPNEFEACLRWVDGRTMASQAKTFDEWIAYMFKPQESQNLRETTDDPDNDGDNNFTEYLRNSDPTYGTTGIYYNRYDYILTGHPQPQPIDTPTLSAHEKGVKIHYRRNAIDAEMTLATSQDLTSWDDTGLNISETNITPLNNSAMAETEAISSESTTANNLFYQAIFTPTPLTNLTQLPGTTATQSTTYNANGVASAAIDGNTNGSFNSGSVTHSDVNTPGNWWQVDLGTDQDIRRLIIWNRDSIQQRLSNFRVEIKNEAGSTVATQNYFITEGHSGTRLVYDLPAPIEARTIKITLLGPNRDNNHILSLAEVEVIGKQP